MTQPAISYEIVEAAPIAFLGVSKKTGCSPEEISAGMGQAFEAVWALMCQNGVKPAGPAVAVYHDYDENSTNWDAGFTVAPNDLEHAVGDVRALHTPSGKALKTLHRGPYNKLRFTYETIMAKMAEDGIKMAGPAWEVYLNDPQTTPPSELLTEVNLIIA